MPRYPYATRYTPPAPILPVRVGRPGSTPTVLLAALMDTGADLSVLPLELPARLRLPVIGRLAVAGVDGFARSLPLYAVQMSIDGYRLLVRVVSLGTTPVIGRDLINRITAHLLGPQAVLAIDLPRGGACG